jgi:hypothetical protein
VGVRVPVGGSRASIFTIDAIDIGHTPRKASLCGGSRLDIERVKNRQNGDSFGESGFGHD